MNFVVGLLGAEGAGRTQLAQALVAHFDALGVPLALAEVTGGELSLPPHCDTLLLTGLDLPDPELVREDARLRAALAQAGAAYQVVYGHGAQRLANALQALARVGIGEALPEPAARADWVWSCEKCSDPECEHRLFRKLLPSS